MSSNEAPRSANVQIKSPNGFYWQFTMREDTADDLIKNMEAIEKVFLDKGWTPVEHKSFGGGGFQKKEKDYVVGRICPLDGGKLYNTTTSTGKKMIKCENGKWDFATKTTIGCTHVEWVKAPGDLF